jgi:hypothetical protein
LKKIKLINFNFKFFNLKLGRIIVIFIGLGLVISWGISYFYFNFFTNNLNQNISPKKVVCESASESFFPIQKMIKKKEGESYSVEEIKEIESRQSQRKNSLLLQNSKEINGKLIGTKESYSSYYLGYCSILKFEIPGAIDYFDYDSKPAGYLLNTLNETVLIQADGSALILKVDTKENSLIYKSIPSNLLFLLPEEVTKASPHSIKGALYFDGYIYISTSWKSNNKDSNLECWKLSIARAEWNPEKKLNFEKWYEPKDCSEKIEFNGHQVGGGMAILNNSVKGVIKPILIFGHGDFRNAKKAQNSKSEFGSLIAISIKNPSKSKIIAKGLRNPQDIKITPSGIFLTDQGPQGGDELNFISRNDLNNKVVNFGWPIASGGVNYNNDLKPDAPLYHDHLRFGFIPPIFEWTPSVGISSIEIDTSERVFVGSLGFVGQQNEGDLSISQLSRSSFDKNLFNLDDLLYMGFRVRDLITTFDNNLMILSDDGSIHFIKLE